MSINLAADVSCEKSAGAPEQEVEVTPEMIEAGRHEVYICAVTHAPAL
jgi:hypothetical protein